MAQLKNLSKADYSRIKSMGMLWEFHPEASGDWWEDCGKYQAKLDGVHGMTKQIDYNYFSQINRKDKSYFLGLLCADGYFHGNSEKITLCLKDLDSLEKFKLSLGSSHKIARSCYFDKRTNKTYCKYSFQLAVKKIHQDLFNLGFRAKKGGIRNLDIIPEELISDFVRGLFDGDGSICIAKRDNDMRVNLIANIDLATSIQTYLYRKLGIAITKLTKVTKNPENDAFKIQIGAKKEVLAFLNYIYKDSSQNIRMDRKHLKYIDCLAMKSLIKKSSNDWLKEPQYKNLIILDPDGFDRTDFDNSMAELIDEKEFNRRVSLSTVSLNSLNYDWAAKLVEFTD